jgi:hypothetical protein
MVQFWSAGEVGDQWGWSMQVADKPNMSTVLDITAR